MTPLTHPPARRARLQTPGLRMPSPTTFILAVLVTLAACPVYAAEPSLPTADSVPDQPAKQPAPPNDPAVQARMPGCAVWTDHCVTCSRKAGSASCSNIGIACQPQAVECLMSEEDAKKLDEKAEKNPDEPDQKKQQN